jgi:hypothetical protein
MTDTDWITMRSKYDGDRPCRLPGRLDVRRTSGEDDIDIHRNKLGSLFRHKIKGSGPTELDDHILALYPTEVTQSLEEGLKISVA